MAENTTRSKKDTARLVAGIVLLVLLVLFAVANSDKTTIDFLVADVDIPLILVLLVTAVVGAAVWELFRFLFRRSRR
ncbi:MAG: hypothetical protein JWL64_1397 [Frankiales bacterium]|nr:hypothetical protein [Frankiales bacterium]